MDRLPFRRLLPGLAFCAAGTAGAQTALAQDVVVPDNWWLPMNAAEHGSKVDGMFTMIFVVTVLVGIAVFATLIWILVKYRYREGRKAVFLHGSHRLEMMWTITPAVLLVVMGVLSIRAWAEIRMKEPAYGEEVVDVEVLAQQFQWNIRYPGEDGVFNTADDIGTFNSDLEPDKSPIVGEIRVPVGRTVRVHLMSKDVLHSFFVPNMRQKMDTVPGLRGTLTFTPTKAGKYDLLCAELCGPQHYSMQGQLVVLEPDEYDEWMQGQWDDMADLLGLYEEEWEEEEDAEGVEEEMDEEDEPEEEAEEEEAEEGETEEAGSAVGPLITPETPAGTIVGRVAYTQDTGEPRTIKPGADVYCQKVAEQNPIIDDSLVTGEHRGLKHVFVKVVDGLPARDWPVPGEPVVLDQKGCRYDPHVFGVMAGQDLVIRNSDNTNHNVHGLPKANQPFNFGQPKAGMKDTLKLGKTESFKIKCDVHAWMNTWCHVVEHPFYAVTDERGVYRISGLEPGEYELELWHEALGTETVEVTLAADKPAEAPEVVFEPPSRRRR